MSSPGTPIVFWGPTQWPPIRPRPRSIASSTVRRTTRTCFFGALLLRGVTGERTRVTVDELAPATEASRGLMTSLTDLEHALSQVHERVRGYARAGPARRRDSRPDDLPDGRFGHRLCVFLEVRGKGVLLRAAPIDVSHIVRDVLIQRNQGTVLTSATLTVDGSFDYLRGRLGLADAFEVRLPSELTSPRRRSLLTQTHARPEARLVYDLGRR